MTDGVLVIGGGIAGISASLNLAEQGHNVHLVEKEPSIGGRMAQLDKTFPTLDCSICILSPKMVEASRHPNITLHTLTEAKSVTRKMGSFSVKLRKHARFVKEEECINCGICTKKCPVKVPDKFDMKLRNRKAIYLYYTQGVPAVMAIDKEHCLHFKKGIC